MNYPWSTYWRTASDHLLMNFPWSIHWWTIPDQPIDELILTPIDKLYIPDHVLMNYVWTTYWWTTPDRPIDELPLIFLLINYPWST